MYECEKCGASTTAMVQMVVCAPSEMMRNFTKKNMSSKEFKIQGVLWETADLICTNSECRHVTNGYGNYVSNLKKENDRLNKELRMLKNEY